MQKPKIELLKHELNTLRKLNTPSKIQDFLNKLPFNFEKKGETYMSPREVLKNKTAHCFEGALLGALALWLQGEKPLIMDLKTKKPDVDHVVVLYKKNRYWGAISKTNHYCLRFRDPIYKTIRELALSYFHEYFWSEDGTKTLVSYSDPFDLSKLKIGWVTSENNLQEIVDLLDESKHYPLVPKINQKFIRKADKIEREVLGVEEYKS
jgi:hypothetical protein